MNQQALQNTLEATAKDVGRLRRLTIPDTSAWWALDRIAANIEGLCWALAYPTAAELYQQYLAASGDEQASLEEALRAVDTQARQLHGLLAHDLAANTARTVHAPLLTLVPADTTAA